MAAETTTTPSTGDHDANPAAEAAEAVHGHEVPAGTTEVAAHGGEGGGLPQFRFEYWGGQIVWLLLIFLLLYILLGRVFVPRLRKVLDTRAETISQAVAEAKQVQAEAEGLAVAAKAEVDQARSEARRVAADAKAKAAAEIAARQAELERELDAKLAEAEGRIRGLRDQAMGNVSVIASETAQAMVQKLTGQAAAPAEVEAAMAARIPAGAH
jgi:F-type H+-transporting ATPase subunit b